MTDLPDPLTPPDCDLNGFAWMPLWGARMFSSSWYRAARKDGRGGIASLKLWWVAMTQRPAGSLPNDEEELCMLADFGEDMRAWRKHRAVAMHGFILCSDNRWYHPFVAEQALEAYARKLKSSHSREATAERVRRHRAGSNGGTPPDKPDGVTQDVTRYEDQKSQPVTRYETRYPLSRDTRQTERQTDPPVAPPGGRADGVEIKLLGRRGGGRQRQPKPGRYDGWNAAEAETERLARTINGNAEDVVEIQEFIERRRGLSNG